MSPRIRYLKPDFFKDDDLATLPFEARLFFAGLWNFADKAGRLEDRPIRLKAEIFPYDDVNVETCLESLCKLKNGSGRPFIQRYEASGEKYIQIINWEKHQKPHHTEKDSIIPPLKKESNKERKTLKIKGMEKGMEKQDEGSVELRNGEVTVKKPLYTTKVVLSDKDFLTALKENPAYKGIDIDRELAKMDAWFLTPKGQGRKKTKRFIVNWLNKIDVPLQEDKKPIDRTQFWCKPCSDIDNMQVFHRYSDGCPIKK